jgi:hypothetical protein
MMKPKLSRVLRRVKRRRKVAGLSTLTGKARERRLDLLR